MAVKKTSKKQKTRSKTASGLTIPVYSAAGMKKGTLVLPKEVFGQKPNPALLAQAARVYLANQRSAGAKTKGRGEVKISTRKIYRQKGTGHARHGAKSAPLFVGGGIAHGPKGIVSRLALPEKTRRLALIQALSSKVKEGALFAADIEKVEPKTKLVAGLLEKIGLRAGTAIVHAGSKELFRAGRNIEGLVLVPANQLTAYEVLAARNILSTKEALDVLAKRLGGKEKQR